MSDQRHWAEHQVNQPVFSDSLQQAIPTFCVLQTDGQTYPDAAMPDIDQPLALKIYQTSCFIRALDERMLASQRQGRISFYMTETGEEAADIGSCAALADDDLIMGQYREQGALAFRGFTVDQFMNQIFSNEQDLGKGRQMPVHYGSRDLHYMTISSPLTTQLPQAAGYAYGMKLRGQSNCVICYFGEGAASEGDFHAALNMAAVTNAPVIFFCRNNGYAISTPAHEQYAGDGIASRGPGYGIRSIRVDGNDVLAVLKATQEARAYAIESHKPVLIEAMTYRLGAHSSSDDPTGYRSRKEEQLWRHKDPVERFKLWLIAQDWWDEAQDQALKEEYRQSVSSAMKRAEKVPAPRLRDLVTDVYQQVPAHLEAQFASLEAHIQRHPEAYPKTAGRLHHG